MSDDVPSAPQPADAPGVDKEALAEAQALLKQFGVTEKDTGVANVAAPDASKPVSTNITTRPLPPIFDKGAQTFVLNERTNNASHLKLVGGALQADPENPELQAQQQQLLLSSNVLATLPKGEWGKHMDAFKAHWDAQHSTNAPAKLPADLQMFVDRTREEAVQGIALTSQALKDGGLDANEVPAIRQQEQFLRGLTNALPRMTTKELEAMQKEGALPDQEELAEINKRPLPSPVAKPTQTPAKGK